MVGTGVGSELGILYRWDSCVRDCPGPLWAQRLKTPNGESPAALNLEIKKDVLKKRKMKKMVEPPPFKIEDFGPGNWGGRVRSILVHPGNPDKTDWRAQ